MKRATAFPNLEYHWYQSSLSYLTLFLLPISWLFRLVVVCRRFLYRSKLLSTPFIPGTVIVVGNVTVGGTGKTPFVIWLAQFLQSQGFKPGVITRGVGGKKQVSPQEVLLSDSPQRVGDEALLLARHTGCPVIVCRNKVKAALSLLKNKKCNVVISDDGLQHYRLLRHIEIGIVDGLRRFGNQCLLPAGPLREPVARLNETDIIVVNQGVSEDSWRLILQPLHLTAVNNPGLHQDLATLRNQPVHAIAGIGHPERFFLALEEAGLTIIRHPFKDHYAFKARDLMFNDDLPVIMTEKDAVKCQSFAAPHWWYLNVVAKMNAGFSEHLLNTLAIKGVHCDETH